MKQFKLFQGDNMISLKKLPDNSIDSIVSDPPYGLSFMGKKWDYDVPSVEFWKEVYRVLKPGGHVLSFGGTRTYHRMAVNIEDAGFEIRDQIMWIYGSGFPKSLNIGKVFDKKQGNERETIGIKTDGAYSPGTNNLGMGQWIKNGEDGRKTLPSRGGDFGKITKGSSQYEGWGTALKPANEPICLARKPLSEKTIVDNVIKWGTGGINVDGCRIGTEDKLSRPVYKSIDTNIYGGGKGMPPIETLGNDEGRFPANIIFDESAAEMLDEQTGYLKSGEVKPHHKKNKTANGYQGSCYGKFQNEDTSLSGYGDGGGASRFFYCAKVSKSERNMGLDGFEEKTIHDDDNKYGIDKSNTLPKKNHHPTLKPVQLMAYLCKLVTPPNGIVLDPFMGSGSTGISACLEGFRFVGMEMSEEYFKIAESRIENYELYRPFVEKKKKK